MKTKPVCETDKYGTKRWYLNDELHREDGPAIEYANGEKQWYRNDTLHREDGPAIEWASGNKAWYINGQPYEPSAHEIIIYKMKYENKTCL
jgi:hypothetical protein